MRTATDGVNQAGIHRYLYKSRGVARMQAEVREAVLRYRKAPV